MLCVSLTSKEQIKVIKLKITINIAIFERCPVFMASHVPIIGIIPPPMAAAI